jgi:two-component system NarL family response regulator
MSRLSVLVAEDHALVRVGLATILNATPDMQVVAEAETGRQAVELFRLHRPDVLLVDLLMPELDGVEITTQVRAEFPRARIVLLTGSDTNEDIYRALKAGAQAYLWKNIRPLELVQALRDVAAGRRVIPPAVAQKLAERLPQSDLSARELDVLRAVVRGLANKEIAHELRLSETTVKTHVANILSKLGVLDRTQAATAALQRGIVR